jgi:hypothetical protein
MINNPFLGYCLINAGKKTCAFTTKRNLGFSKPKIWHGNYQMKTPKQSLAIINSTSMLCVHWKKFMPLDYYYKEDLRVFKT